MKVGETLKELRTSLGLTQTQVARGAGLSCSLVSNVERGERVPYLPTLERLARAMGMRVVLSFEPADSEGPGLELPVVEPKLRAVDVKRAMESKQVIGAMR